MTELPIVSLLRRGHAQPCECVECTAAALIREQHLALMNVRGRLIANGMPDAMRVADLCEIDAALAKAREA